MMLICLDEARFQQLSKDERNQIHRDCGAWHHELVRNGQSLGAGGLQSSTTATTVRLRDGQPIITDGPYAETREVLGGYELLECRDLDEALAIAQRFPGLRAGGSVELRPMVAGESCEEP